MCALCVTVAARCSAYAGTSYASAPENPALFEEQQAAGLTDHTRFWKDSVEALLLHVQNTDGRGTFNEGRMHSFYGFTHVFHVIAHGIVDILHIIHVL